MTVANASVVGGQYVGLYIEAPINALMVFKVFKKLVLISNGQCFTKLPLLQSVHSFNAQFSILDHLI